ncbi:hypothetical protein DV735_g3391, partial [Chaetothyriales sp. CBS 134920]
MSEYWKSTPKYWCKHCSIYVRDTPFERKQHESTAKHQGKLKYFLRDIQNNHERSEREKEKAKAEVERLNRLTGTGVGTPQSVSVSAKPSTRTPTSNKDKGAQRTADDQKRQWQQLADMGIKVPDHVRTEMAMAGDWQAVRQHKAEGVAEDRLSVGVRKRKAGDDMDDELEEIPQVSTLKKIWEQQHVIKKEEEETADHAEDAAQDAGGGASSMDQSDDSGAQSAAKTGPKVENCDGVVRGMPEEATAAPVFKKRKAKGKS